MSYVPIPITELPEVEVLEGTEVTWRRWDFWLSFLDRPIELELEPMP